MKTALKLTITAAALFSFAGTAQADGDPKAGEKVFRKCKACHMVGENARRRVGPPLNGIVGSKAASYDNFNYSKNMKELAKEGLTWTEDKLDAYLKDPKAVVPKGKMPFPGLKKEEDRENVIAYLKTFSKE